jgi:hypothetical protein
MSAGNAKKSEPPPQLTIYKIAVKAVLLGIRSPR